MRKRAFFDNDKKKSWFSISIDSTKWRKYVIEANIKCVTNECKTIAVILHGSMVHTCTGILISSDVELI
jgi:hypothetical protein